MKSTKLSVEEQYPKKISKAILELYKSAETTEARKKGQNVQIRYTAKPGAQLFIDGKCKKDALSNWFDVLSYDRIHNINIENKNS